MNNTDRYIIQKDLQSRFYSFSNTPNTALDNFILNHIKFKNEIHESSNIEKAVLKTTEEVITEEIKKVFK